MSDHIRKRIDGKYCIYCGERPNEDEHFPPRSVGNRGFILPCCSECNRFAGATHPRNFIARAEMVKEKIGNKYGRLKPLKLERLIEEEEDNERCLQLLEMERNRLKMVERLAWSAEAYIKVIVPTKDFALFDVKTNSTIISELSPSEPKPNTVTRVSSEWKPSADRVADCWRELGYVFASPITAHTKMKHIWPNVTAAKQDYACLPQHWRSYCKRIVVDGHKAYGPR